MRYLFSILLIAAPALAQIVSLGVKAGVPLGDPITGVTGADVTPDVRRYLIGGTVEVHLPRKFSVELDAIYKRTGFSTGVFGSTDFRFSDQITANQWEFPLLAKYEILSGRIRPFLDAGPVLRHISGFRDVSVLYFPSGFPSGTFNNTPDLQKRNSPGFAVGGGVTFKILHVRISPEFRYTRWGSSAFQISQFQLGQVSNVNQEDLLVGFTF
jgi:opacity protein-like surface antigen